jgi:5-methylcytosine-specific restriction endonuclease McrA
MRGRNVVAACNGCNHLKGEMTEAEFRLVMEIIRNLLKLG